LANRMRNHCFLKASALKRGVCKSKTINVGGDLLVSDDCV